MEATKKEITVTLAPLALKKILVPIRGKGTLVMSRQSEEVKEAILAKQTGKAQANKKMVRNIDQEIHDSMHFFPDGKTVGFPSNGFKAGMIEATSFVGDKSFSKKLIKGVNIIDTTNDLVKIEYSKQSVLRHNPTGRAERFSPQFHEWKTTLTIEFDSNNISESDILTLLNYAGYYSGIGTWSPRCKCGGSHGTYEVAMKK